MDKVNKFTRLKQGMDKLGLPIAYHHFNEPVNPPFVVYYSPHVNNFVADNEIYMQTDYIEIELYTEGKDFELEQKVHDILTELNIIYGKYEAYIKEENLFMQTYELEI
ncbi:hypothetical protein IRY55_02565 [Savagea sp. SN6]|uniref:Uncharacterized protein n=1 Tax=Savagea serpentis TaxID=2785297 RepID=A0A8J7G8Q8_9BACL|nr:hypothetical protein [Savagea serpentis]MBF4500234.1 hypothetical protein [Savagea serpentis]